MIACRDDLLCEDQIRKSGLFARTSRNADYNTERPCFIAQRQPGSPRRQCRVGAASFLRNSKHVGSGTEDANTLLIVVADADAFTVGQRRSHLVADPPLVTNDPLVVLIPAATSRPGFGPPWDSLSTRPTATRTLSRRSRSPRRRRRFMAGPGQPEPRSDMRPVIAGGPPRVAEDRLIGTSEPDKHQGLSEWEKTIGGTFRSHPNPRSSISGSRSCVSPFPAGQTHSLPHPILKLLAKAARRDSHPVQRLIVDSKFQPCAACFQPAAPVGIPIRQENHTLVVRAPPAGRCAALQGTARPPGYQAAATIAAAHRAPRLQVFPGEATVGHERQRAFARSWAVSRHKASACANGSPPENVTPSMSANASNSPASVATETAVPPSKGHVSGATQPRSETYTLEPKSPLSCPVPRRGSGATSGRSVGYSFDYYGPMLGQPYYCAPLSEPL